MESNDPLEVRSARQIVDILYRALLGRAPDETGHKFHAKLIASGFYKDEADFAAAIFASSEYRAKHGEVFSLVDLWGCRFLWPQNAVFGNEYENWVLPYFLDHCRPGMNVCDIGACWGIYALPAAKRVAPEGRVYAVEVSPRNSKILRQSAVASGVDNLTILQLGLSDRLGSEQLWRQTTHPNNTLKTDAPWVQQDFAAIDLVTVLPLDLIYPALGRIDLIKADIEGMEYRVFSTGKVLLAEQKPTVFMEYSPNFQKAGSGVAGEELLKLFFDFGYKVEILHRQRPREPVGLASVCDIIAHVDAAWAEHCERDGGSHLDLRLWCVGGAGPAG